MANVYCSSKLKLFLIPLTGVCKENDEQWNAHLFYLGGKKCILFLNKETIYSFVLFGVLKKDVSNIHALFVQGLVTQLYADKILLQKHERLVIDHYKDLRFLPTNNDRSVIGSINDCIARITFSVDSNKSSIEDAKAYVAHQVNYTPMGAVGYSYPSDLMKEKINNLSM